MPQSLESFVDGERFRRFALGNAKGKVSVLEKWIGGSGIMIFSFEVTFRRMEATMLKTDKGMCFSRNHFIIRDKMGIKNYAYTVVG